jgi:methenyltetrahydromethanopterin cyclohydrolase
LADEATAHRVAVIRLEGGARLIDCGLLAEGGLEAGIALAEICLADLGRVHLVPGSPEIWPGPAIMVRTDQPLAACMASQYAGWQIAGDKFFAMGSGPMRAARGREEIFREIGYVEKAERIVGILETGKVPTAAVCEHIAVECQVTAEQLTLLVAPARSQAGAIQVVARSVETALHKLHTLNFDLKRIVSGMGIAPLPPTSADDLTGIGRTNDAVLYGGRVTLWVRGTDEEIERYGPNVPSSSSRDYGQPFGTVFANYDHDFYRVDPLLFSPAQVTFVNLDSGHSFTYGETNADILRQSFA